EPDPGGADHPGEAAEEDRTLVEHHAAGHVTEHRRRGLVTARAEVEVDEAAADLAVVLAAGAAGEKTVTEIDQAPQDHEREDDRHLESNIVGEVAVLLEQAALAAVKALAHLAAFEEHGVLHEPA